jgi:hypothetical protein
MRKFRNGFFKRELMPLAKEVNYITAAHAAREAFVSSCIEVDVEASTLLVTMKGAKSSKAPWLAGMGL